MRTGVVGGCVRAFRRERGLSVRELSAQMGVSPSTLCRIERGRAVDGQTLIRLMRWLLGDDSVAREVSGPMTAETAVQLNLLDACG